MLMTVELSDEYFELEISLSATYIAHKCVIDIIYIFVYFLKAENTVKQKELYKCKVRQEVRVCGE